MAVPHAPWRGCAVRIQNRGINVKNYQWGAVSDGRPRSRPPEAQPLGVAVGAAGGEIVTRVCRVLYIGQAAPVPATLEQTEKETKGKKEGEKGQRKRENEWSLRAARAAAARLPRPEAASGIGRHPPHPSRLATSRCYDPNRGRVRGGQVSWKTRFGHNNGSQAPISTQYVWAPSASHATRCVRGGVGG